MSPKPISLAERLPRLEGAVPPAWLIDRPSVPPVRPLLKRADIAAVVSAPAPAVDPAEIERIHAAARTEGETAGVAAGKKKVEDILERYSGAIERLASAAGSLDASSVDLIVRMAMSVASQIVSRELMIDPEPVARAVEEALAEIGAERPVLVRLGATDLAYFRARRPDLLAAGVELIEDQSLGIGGCVVEASHRVIDASIENRLLRIGERLQRELGQSEAA